MAKKETIVFFHGKIKRRYRKPEKTRMQTGIRSTAEISGQPGLDFRPPRVHPLLQKGPMARPYYAVPRLRRRFVLPAPKQVRRAVIADKESKRHSIFHEEIIFPTGHKIIWGYNPYTGEYALGDAAARIQDGWDHMYGILVTERSDRMRDIQHAVAAAAVLMLMIIGVGPQIVEGSMTTAPVEAVCAVRAVDVYCDGEYMGMVPSEEMPGTRS